MHELLQPKISHDSVMKASTRHQSKIASPISPPRNALLFRGPLGVTIGKRLEKDGLLSIKRRGVEGEQDVPVGDGAATLLAAISA